jgi:tryptophanyl-tRNA synthetase
MGLFMYPLLMGADILMFNAHKVPVGRDQIQHIEMARDMANSFNHRYGDHFVLPQAAIEESVATLPGLDGRKMSKSYDNIIPLFTPREHLQKLINGIVTDSRTPGEAKDTQNSALFQIYQAFASEQETRAMDVAFAKGIAWGDAKQILFERIDQELAPMRSRYRDLMNDPNHIEDILQQGAVKARKIALPFRTRLRNAVGLRRLQNTTSTIGEKQAKAPTATFKQYRENNGKFYFKLLDANGKVLLQSLGFDSPKVAGQSIRALQSQGVAAITEIATQLEPVAEANLSAIGQALRSFSSD